MNKFLFATLVIVIGLTLFLLGAAYDAGWFDRQYDKNAVSVSVPQALTDWKTYVDTAHRFSFQYPENYVARDVADGRVVVYDETYYSDDASHSLSFVVYTDGTPRIVFGKPNNQLSDTQKKNSFDL